MGGLARDIVSSVRIGESLIGADLIKLNTLAAALYGLATINIHGGTDSRGEQERVLRLFVCD